MRATSTVAFPRLEVERESWAPHARIRGSHRTLIPSRKQLKSVYFCRHTWIVVDFVKDTFACTLWTGQGLSATSSSNIHRKFIFDSKIESLEASRAWNFANLRNFFALKEFLYSTHT